MIPFSKELENEVRRDELNLKDNEVLSEDLLNSIENIELFADDLTGLQNLKNLKHLTISADEVPIEVLKEMPWLKSLHIRNSGIENCDLIKIAQLDNLISLGIPGNENITTLHPLQEMKSLKSLDLSSNWMFSTKEEGTIEELRKFTFLEALCIDNIPIDSLDFIDPLVNLKVLEIADDGSNSDLKDLSNLRNLQKLQNLNIWDHTKIEDYSVLKELDSLNQVYLSKENLERVEQLEIIIFLEAKGCTVDLQEW